MISVAVLMGSQSDMPVMQKCKHIFESIGISHEFYIISAHRTPNRLFEFASSAEKNGFKVIIAGAGGAAHLPGMTASLTTLPVIGVPILSKNLRGIDSLLSIVQMPSGVPVLTVSINGSENAALGAANILAISDQEISMKLKSWRKKMTESVQLQPFSV